MEKAWDLLRQLVGDEITDALYNGKSVYIRASNGYTYKLFEEHNNAVLMNVDNKMDYCINCKGYHSLPLADQFVFLLDLLHHAPEILERVAHKTPRLHHNEFENYREVVRRSFLNTWRIFNF